MNYKMTTPCENCPFRRVGGVRVNAERAEELTDNALSTQGASFACHKTVKALGSKAKEESHCAGALIFSEKNGNATQLMRIMERLGAYDARKLNRAVFGEVFDTAEEMIEVSLG